MVATYGSLGPFTLTNGLDVLLGRSFGLCEVDFGEFSSHRVCM